MFALHNRRSGSQASPCLSNGGTARARNWRLFAVLLELAVGMVIFKKTENQSRFFGKAGQLAILC